MIDFDCKGTSANDSPLPGGRTRPAAGASSPATVMDALRHSVLRILCLALPALLSTGCASLLWRVDEQQQWSATVVYPAVSLEADANVKLPRSGEPGYNLYVLTDSKGFDFSNAKAFLKTLHKHPRGGKQDHSVGHSWLLLQSPDELLECGHTGEFGLDEPGYYRGITSLIRKRDADPIRYLHTTMRDGEYHSGPGSHEASFVARFPITSDEHRAILAYIDGYDYSVFSVTDRQCTDFVLGALRIIGVKAATRMRLALPQTVHYGFKEFRIWTNPEFSTVTIGFADVLEKQLRQMVERGQAYDATEWYFE